MTKSTKNDRILRGPLKSGDVLVTQKMLEETRNELKSDITSVRLEVRGLRSDMDAKFATMQGQMDSRFAEMQGQMDSRFSKMQSQMDTQFALVGSQFAQLGAAMEANFAKMHRTHALSEEQHARNVAVLESYDQIYRQHEEFETRLKKIENSHLK
jgi:hypothetical protein